MYKVREFAMLAGVTVRTLHHYDRLGLLSPRRSTAAGYRLYQERDLEKLEQIVALKFLGFPLAEIRELLERKPLRLTTALEMQRRMLQQKRELLDRAMAAIGAAVASTQTGPRPHTAALQKIIEVIAMEKQTDWTQKYYSEEAWAKIKDRRLAWTPEMQADISQQWTDLVRDVEAALGCDPAGAKAQALVARWDGLVGQFTQHNPKIVAGAKKAFADRANWPAEMKPQMTPFTPEVMAFIGQARAARA